MLSVKHHVGFWLASVAGRVVYETLVSQLRPGVLWFIFLVTALKLLPVIAGGPPATPQTPAQTRVHFVAMAVLLTAMGVSVEAICDVSGASPIALGHERVMHILLAFTILGILEPIRQNVSREDGRPPPPPSQS